MTKKIVKEMYLIPNYVLYKFKTWVQSVQEIGLEETRKIPGYHDEPLKGKRKGQRSIRLNKSYRVIYRIEEHLVKFIEVIEINNHDY